MRLRRYTLAFQLSMALPVTVYYITGVLEMVRPGAGVLILGAPLFICIYAFLFLTPLICGLLLADKSAQQSASTLPNGFAKLTTIIIILIILEIIIGCVVTQMEHGIGLASSILQPVGTTITLVAVVIHEFKNRKRRTT